MDNAGRTIDIPARYGKTIPALTRHHDTELRHAGQRDFDVRLGNQFTDDLDRRLDPGQG